MKSVLRCAVGNPLLLHFLAWAICQESDSPALVFLASMFSTFASALLAVPVLGAVGGAAGSLWVPAAASYWDLHWKMDCSSPHGPSMALTGLLGWQDPTGGRLSHVLLSALAFAAAGALLQASPALRGQMRSVRLSELGDD